MKYTNQEYLDATDDLFEDGDAEIRCYEKRLVAVRKDHPCMAADIVSMPAHQVTKGARGVRESAIVDGVFGSSYVCLPCIELWLDKIKPEIMRGK